MIRSILLSLSVTAVVSTVCSTLTYYIFGVEFIRSFVVAFLLQLVVFYLWNSLMQVIMTSRVEVERTKQAELLSQQGVDANCAYCGNMNFIPMRMDETNDFKCQNCGKMNSVYVDVTIAQQTEILNKKTLSISAYNKGEDDAKSRIQQEK